MISRKMNSTGLETLKTPFEESYPQNDWRDDYGTDGKFTICFSLFSFLSLVIFPLIFDFNVRDFQSSQKWWLVWFDLIYKLQPKWWSLNLDLIWCILDSDCMRWWFEVNIYSQFLSLMTIWMMMMTMTLINGNPLKSNKYKE